MIWPGFHLLSQTLIAGGISFCLIHMEFQASPFYITYTYLNTHISTLNNCPHPFTFLPATLHSLLNLHIYPHNEMAAMIRSNLVVSRMTTASGLGSQAQGPPDRHHMTVPDRITNIPQLLVSPDTTFALPVLADFTPTSTLFISSLKLIPPLLSSSHRLK